MTAGPWIKHDGSARCPVDPDTLIQVCVRKESPTDGGFNPEVMRAGTWIWKLDSVASVYDIVYWRLADVKLPVPEVTVLDRRTGDKPTNPKDAIGSTKLPLHLVSPIVKAYQAIAHFLGNVKYGAHNYIACGSRASIYKAACDRHMDAWWAGEELDPDDGTPHLANALACIGILIECSEAGNLTDDRPPSTDYRRVRSMLEPMMARILEKHGEKRPRHYTIADTKAAKEGAFL